jgi:hypothetical protein
LRVSAKPDAKPIWKEIRAALADGCSRRKLICPLPFECVIETAPKALEFRQAIQSLFCRLSRGVAFKDYTQMSSELTLALIRPIPDWSPWMNWRPMWAEMESATQKVAADQKSAKQRMQARMDSFVRSPNLATMSKGEIFHAVAAQRSVWIANDLDCLLAGRVQEDSLNCPWLIELLISENLSPAEIETLKQAVLHHGWAKIPIHAFDILLSAKWEYDSMLGGSAAYEPNDEIDRKRAAIALSYADLFITEGDLANLCKKAKVDEFSPTAVIPIRNPQEILETVRRLARD